MPVPPDEFNLKYGPWALVTGASDGIGSAIAEELGAGGLNLILVARSKDRLDRLAASLRSEHGIDSVAVAADLGREAGVQMVLDATDHREVGLYAGCAGFGTAGPFAENRAEDELNMIDVNCRALAELAHRRRQRMRKRSTSCWAATTSTCTAG